MQKTLFFVAFIGLIISGYLWTTYVTDIPLICGEDSGCYTIRASQYSSLFGIPIPAYGVVFYTLLGIFAALWNSDYTPRPNLFLRILTLIGFLVSAWFTYLQASVVGAWGVWSITSAVLATIALLLVWLHSK